MKKNKDKNIFYKEKKLKNKKLIISLSKTTKQEKKDFLVGVGVVIFIILLIILIKGVF